MNRGSVIDNNMSLVTFGDTDYNNKE